MEGAVTEVGRGISITDTSDTQSLLTDTDNEEIIFRVEIDSTKSAANKISSN